MPSAMRRAQSSASGVWSSSATTELLYPESPPLDRARRQRRLSLAFVRAPCFAQIPAHASRDTRMQRGCSLNPAVAQEWVHSLASPHDVMYGQTTAAAAAAATEDFRQEAREEHNQLYLDYSYKEPEPQPEVDDEESYFRGTAGRSQRAAESQQQPSPASTPFRTYGSCPCVPTYFNGMNATPASNCSSIKLSRGGDAEFTGPLSHRRDAPPTKQTFSQAGGAGTITCKRALMEPLSSAAAPEGAGSQLLRLRRVRWVARDLDRLGEE